MTKVNLMGIIKVPRVKFEVWGHESTRLNYFENPTTTLFIYEFISILNENIYPFMSCTFLPNIKLSLKYNIFPWHGIPKTLTYHV
jgi:hypothetical protein